ncbi:fructoselysine-6-P-deglycase FrlB-like protein [Naumannella cuiyingiana]|uniref:Fructoselysine-6-P-deglycase FrlB-like protein n=1 Tax=Naumannella cuiyingiana TaxID=1347891 RepID=A0A7Z0ILJ0_9ACTN|nr:SIS domain-containing protein [Naumannella cuiyingiana]NYI71675.1 fructoselysine-6-P-deglycase FrlB-like protein [Naumannella cuiyingiana]
MSTAAEPSYFVESEIASQPETWQRAIELAPELADRLPRPGERVAFVGCGTSWFIAQAAAALREAAGQGESDAFAASEFPRDRRYDRVVALTRSGTTTEVIDLLRELSGRTPTVVLLGDVEQPAAAAADEVIDLSFADERSVVQTRFATTALVLLRAWLDAEGSAALPEAARTALSEPIPDELPATEQITFLGTGWTYGLANEAALKFRETSSSWAESYPAMDYRHGPISIAEPGRVVWMFGTPPAGLAEDVAATGATFRAGERDPLADLVVAQRVAVARARHLGLDPDRPRSLTRSIILDEPAAG